MWCTLLRLGIPNPVSGAFGNVLVRKYMHVEEPKPAKAIR